MPNETKRRRGTARSDRVPALSQVVALPQLIEPPEPIRPLGRVGRQMWDSAWEHAGAWLAKTDIQVVQQLCEQLDERAALRVEVLQHGDWRKRLALRQLDAQVLAGLSALGFTPVDRSRLGVAEVVRVSKLDQLRRSNSSA